MNEYGPPNYIEKRIDPVKISKEPYIKHANAILFLLIKYLFSVFHINSINYWYDQAKTC